MVMLDFLSRHSRRRRIWLLVAITAFGLEVIALWFQHIIGLQPCIFCIYERSALFGIMCAGLIGAIAPKTALHYVAITIWLYSSWKGVMLSWKHTMIQLHPSPFMTCSFATIFPNWLPLDKWLPQIFLASSNCSARQLEFLKLGIPQWLVGVFVVYFIIALLVLIALPFRAKKIYLKDKH